MQSLTLNVPTNTVHTVFIVAIGTGGQSSSGSFTFRVPMRPISYTMVVPYNTTHTVSIGAVSSNGQSYSAPYTFRVPSRLFPNPPQSRQPIQPFPIQFPNSGKKAIDIYNPYAYWGWGSSPAVSVPVPIPIPIPIPRANYWYMEGGGSARTYKTNARISVPTNPPSSVFPTQFVRYSNAVIDSNNILYFFGSNTNSIVPQLISTNLSTGATTALFQPALATSYGISIALTPYDTGTIYIFAPYSINQTFLYAVNMNGTQKWVYTDNQLNFVGDLTTDNTGVIYFPIISRNQNAVRAINNNGSIKWTYTVPQQVSSVSSNIDAVYFVTLSTMYALNLDGTLKWSNIYNPSGSSIGNVYPLAPSIDNNGNIYICSMSAAYAFTPLGSILWTHAFSIPASTAFSRIAIGRDIYISISSISTVYSLSKLTGTENWNTPIATDNIHISGDDTIYVASAGPTVVTGLNPANGNTLTSIPFATGSGQGGRPGFVLSTQTGKLLAAYPPNNVMMNLTFSIF